MNEISIIKPVQLAANNRGNSLPAKAADGKPLPIAPSEAPKTLEIAAQDGVAQGAQAQDQQRQQLQDALGSMNEYVQNVKRDLQFSVDQELNQTVIKVVDSASGELIRQIPEDIFLELARKVKETGEMNLLNATG